MVESVECVGNVFWHRHINFAIGVVPCKCDATKKVAAPINSDFVMLADCIDEVFCMLVAFYFNAKIVND